VHTVEGKKKEVTGLAKGGGKRNKVFKKCLPIRGGEEVKLGGGTCGEGKE